jgi:hypothetical protein
VIGDTEIVVPWPRMFEGETTPHEVQITDSRLLFPVVSPSKSRNAPKLPGATNRVALVVLLHGLARP